MKNLGRTLFYAGTAILFLMGIFHAVGHFSGPPENMGPDQMNALLRMETVKFNMPGGEQRTMDEIMNAYSLYFAIFPVALAAVMFFVRKSLAVLRPSLVVSIMAMLLSGFVTWKYAIFPPLIMMGIVAVCYVGALLLIKEEE